MTDNPKHSPTDDPNEGEIPASVAFMEMMRQAAARAEAQRRPAQSAPAARPATQVDVQTPPVVPPVQVAEESEAMLAAREAQRVRRVRRRADRRRRRTVGVLGGLLRSSIIVVIAAGLMATIFTWWTPSGFIDDDVRQELSVAVATSAVTLQPTGLPTPNWLRRVGIVSGHRGPQGDPGAVCPDGLTEAEINFNVARAGCGRPAGRR